jgi:hypothetical protein
MAETVKHQKSLNEPKVQNPMPDYGQARSRDARCRQFGVLGFPDGPEAAIGGTLIHKVSEEESERKSGDEY